LNQLSERESLEKLPDLFDLTGRVAVVTGGAGFLGGEFSRTLLEAGANTVIADIDEGAAQDTAASLNEMIANKASVPKEVPQRALAVGTDISTKESVQQMVAKVVSEFQRVDILVNNAALDPKFDQSQEMKLEEGEQRDRKRDPLTKKFEDFPIDLWNQALDVNLTGMFLCCQSVGKQMLKQGSGVIINIASIYGLVGPDQRLYEKNGEQPKYKPAYYSVTKSGVLGFTSYLATYYAGKGIRVNALTPGGVFNEHDKAFIDAYTARTVMGRMAEKSEMNGALLFLASDASSYMTGGNLVVDGGWTAW
jgi:2-deoxy-D-gluconate 3-dehydrogenase